jgi:hypothetical protein
MKMSKVEWMFMPNLTDVVKQRYYCVSTGFSEFLGGGEWGGGGGCKPSFKNCVPRWKK